MRYQDSGVDIDVAHRAKQRIKQLARRSFNARVVREVGAFGGFFGLDGLPRDAVLVSSMDGVGTKLKLAFALGRHKTIGSDLVNHCINDIAVHGAAPLFLLDYLAAGRLDYAVVTEIVEGITQACAENGCALVGGETAEMPGFYQADEYDLAGCIVGWVRRSKIIDGSQILPGDIVLGLASAGLHTNGYSLARKVLLEQAGFELDEVLPELGRTLGEELLAPHRCYWKLIEPLLGGGERSGHTRSLLSGLVHITGGGLTENPPRILPKNCRMEIRLGSWPVPAVFQLIERLGQVPDQDMLRTFNMGIGMMLVVSEPNLEAVSRLLRRTRERFWQIGRIVRGKRGVNYVQSDEP
jgi:phosphoribosylformylglycinamidine cyclo-ligase